MKVISLNGPTRPSGGTNSSALINGGLGVACERASGSFRAGQRRLRQENRSLKSHVMLASEAGALKQNCLLIKAMIAEMFAGMGSGGSLGGSAYVNTVKQEVTHYLKSVGTPAALNLLKSYEATGWQKWVL